MTHTLDEVRQIAFELSEKDRIRLATSLWESVESDSEIDEEWKIEVERRIDELDSGSAQAIPEEAMRQEMQAMRSRLSPRG
jgi:putative addiction module component (TIGR02574 family)